MILGVWADYVEISSNVDEKTRNELAMAGQLYLLNNLETKSSFGEKAGRGLMATAKNLSSKTYFKGLADILDALGGEEEWKWKKVYEGKVKSLVPNIVRQMTNDPYYRETRSFYDLIKSGVPYWSKSVEPRYNFLGKPEQDERHWFERMVTPIEISEKKKDPLLEEIAKLNVGIPETQEKIGNIELADFSKDGKTAYARFNELIAEEGLEEALRDLIKKPKYIDASASFGTGDVNYSGSKIMLIHKELTRARKRAKKNLRNEGYVSESGLNLDEALDNDLRNKKNVKKNNLEDLLSTK
jgi:hypothetical protein